MTEFLKKEPILSGDEEVVTKAGENIPDPWANEKPSGLVMSFSGRYDHEGKITNTYKNLREMLHMVDTPLHKQLSDAEQSKLDRKTILLVKKWRKIQKQKKMIRDAASKRIEKQRDGYLAEDLI